VDGRVEPVTAEGIALGPGARVGAVGTGSGIAIDFPDGTRMTATSHYWGAPHDRWYLNVSVLQTPASEGVMGDLADGWLPALPDGSSLGPRPAAADQRYADLYETFEEAWRVSDDTSLFDYAAGESPATFAIKDWPPKEGSSCEIPRAPYAEPMPLEEAMQVCRDVRDEARNAHCVFDVAITGHDGFVKAYLASLRIEAGATRTVLNVNGDRLRYGQRLALIAAVSPAAAAGAGVPAGTVRFSIDGNEWGEPVKLDERGWAVTSLSRLAPGEHEVEARFQPAARSVFLPSVAGASIVVVQEGLSAASGK